MQQWVSERGREKECEGERVCVRESANEERAAEREGIGRKRESRGVVAANRSRGRGGIATRV